MVPGYLAGRIYFDTTRLPNEFPTKFFKCLTVLRMTLSRELEAGCRPIIALFLGYAVTKARELFHQERLTVHMEVPIPAIQIPEVGLVGGKLDFLVGDVIGKADIGTSSCLADSLLWQVSSWSSWMEGLQTWMFRNQFLLLLKLNAHLSYLRPPRRPSSSGNSLLN